MGKRFTYFILFTSTILLSGCSNTNVQTNIQNKPISNKIWKADKDFIIYKIGHEKKKYTASNKFIEVSKIRDFQIVKSINSELHLAIDKEGILSHRIIEHNNTNFTISPYSYIISPYTIKFE